LWLIEVPLGRLRSSSDITLYLASYETI
jgi:hypothetical protein